MIRKRKYELPISVQFSNIFLDQEIKIISRYLIPTIVGITGPTKSGKTNLARILCHEYNFHYVNLTTVITSYARILGEENINWESLGKVACKIREQNYDYFFAEKVLEEIERKNYPEVRYVIDGILHPSEIEYFKKETRHFLMVGLSPSLDVRKRYLENDGTMNEEELLKRDCLEQVEQDLTKKSNYFPNVRKCLLKVDENNIYAPENHTRKALIKIAHTIGNELFENGYL